MTMYMYHKQSTAELNRISMQQQHHVTKFQEPEIYRLWKEIPTREVCQNFTRLYFSVA